MNQIIRFGRVIRPGLGLLLVPDNTVANLEDRGAVIRSVVPGSGAERAKLRRGPLRCCRCRCRSCTLACLLTGHLRRGLTQAADGTVSIGDIIVSVGGQPVVGVDDVHSAMEAYSVGQHVALGIKRGREVLTVMVPLLQEVPQRPS